MKVVITVGSITKTVEVPPDLLHTPNSDARQDVAAARVSRAFAEAYREEVARAEAAVASAPRTHQAAAADCCGCGTSTADIHEQFILLPAVWERAVTNPAPLARNAGGRLVLCVGCVENRLGRLLDSTDFNWASPVNHLAKASDRLRARMGSGLVSEGAAQ